MQNIYLSFYFPVCFHSFIPFLARAQDWFAALNNQIINCKVMDKTCLVKHVWSSSWNCGRHWKTAVCFPFMIHFKAWKKVIALIAQTQQSKQQHQKHGKCSWWNNTWTQNKKTWILTYLTLWRSPLHFILYWRLCLCHFLPSQCTAIRTIITIRTVR